ncbi:MAG: HAD family hydrolase [Actinomycetota bacterium]|nr:HAD family hydrolase [Actinomycetota bacterium]
MNRKRFDAVLFDVGGVLQLIDYERVEAALSPSTAKLHREIVYAAHYIALAELEQRSDAEEKPVEYGDYLDAYVRALGVPGADHAEVVTRLTDQLSDGEGWNDVVPGAVKVLRDLHDLGMRLGIVSNTPLGGVARRLSAAGLCQKGTGTGACVDVIIDSHDAGVTKPHPAIFEAAIRELGVASDSIAFVGDSLIADVRGSSAAGMQPIHYDPHSLCIFRDHLHATSLSEIPALIGAA